MDEKQRDQAYRHRSTVTGTGDPDDKAIEHQDTALGNAAERNELTPGERGGRERGPTTHDDTRIDRGGR